MTRNDNNRIAAGIARARADALDPGTIDARARQLRAETVRTLFVALAHWTACRWARVANLVISRPLPDGCARC